MESPLFADLIDRSWKRVGALGGAAIVPTPRHNGQGTAQIILPLDHRQAAAAVQPGMRVRIFQEDACIVSGPIKAVSSTGTAAPTLTLEVQDWWGKGSEMLGWPVATSPLTGQTAEYRTLTGPAETVAKAIFRETATRLGYPLTIAPDQGRGGTITAVQWRFHPIYDRLYPLLDQAGIGLTIRQAGTRTQPAAGLVLDCYATRSYPRVLSVQSGAITEMSWRRAAPTATRVVVGGQGEGTARVFRSVQDAAAEAEWGDVLEDFLDATDVDNAAADRNAQLDARGRARLLETASSAGFDVTLAETRSVRYSHAGDGLRVGDQVQVEILPGLVVTDTLRAATLSVTTDSGYRVTPQIGDSQKPLQILATALARAVRAQRDRKA